MKYSDKDSLVNNDLQPESVTPFIFNYRSAHDLSCLMPFGPLQMRPVNRVGLVTEISPQHYFLSKNFNVFI